MKIAKEKVDLKKTLIAILTMLLGVVCVDLYLVVIRFTNLRVKICQRFEKT